jgi:hypothetical protein
MINSRLLVLLGIAATLTTYGVWTGGQILTWRMEGQTSGAPGPASSAQDRVSAGSPNSAAPDHPLNPYAGITAEELSELTDRPLFNPTRAPAAEAVVPQPAPIQTAVATAATAVGPPPGDFTLQAVASGENGQYAVVRDNTSGTVFHIKEGQPIDDWQVKEVGVRDITLMRQDRLLQLKLFDSPPEVPIQETANPPDNSVIGIPRGNPEPDN